MTFDASWTHWINAFAGQWEVLDGIMIALTKGGAVLLVALIALR
jgi:hypothetical protein